MGREPGCWGQCMGINGPCGGRGAWGGGKAASGLMEDLGLGQEGGEAPLPWICAGSRDLAVQST